MAKTKSKTSPVPTSISVRYDLLELPTAQHKAGLAGLLMQISSMKARALPAISIPEVEQAGTTVINAKFTKESLAGLFDDLYDGKKVLAESSTRWPGATPVEEKDKPDPKTGKLKKVFIYEVVQPQGHFLQNFTNDGKEVWHKLWREMLWAIPRGKPTTRGPFNKRAAGESSGEGEAAWNELLGLEKAKEKNESLTCEVSGAILIGAQAMSAESVPFRDRVDQALLLHFWQLTVRIFIPEQIDFDGSREFVGYVLAIPEVANLPQFVKRYTRALENLDPKLSGYRPAGAVISLPAQGALEFMDGLARMTAEATSADFSDVARALAGVEFFHLVKAGNNVKTMTHGRIAATPGLLADYEAVKSTCRNPMFRSARLLALLRSQAWHSEFEKILFERPWPLFVQSEKTPRNLPPFAWDATQKFRSILQNEYTRKADAMSNNSPSPPANLETLVYRLVRSYVRAKTEQKCGFKYDSFKDKKVKDSKGRDRVEYPRAYTEAQEKVCSDLFLGMRSRRDDDFISFFTGTIGSVAQGMNLSNEVDFQVVAQALLDQEQRRTVQTLAMLAVSAASYASSASTDEDESTEVKEKTR